MTTQRFIPVQGTDEEIIANARQLAIELHRHNKTLEQRGIEVGCTYTYNGGRVEVEYERVRRKKM